MTLSEIKKHLKSLVIKDVAKALKKLESILDGDSSFYNDTILQQSSLNSLKRDKNAGIISPERSTLRGNQIRNSVVEMISMLDEDDIDFEMAKSELTSSSAKVTTKPSPPSTPTKGDSESAPTSPSSSSSTDSGIYISYAWGDIEDKSDWGYESEKIVNQLYEELTERGIKIIRDKNELGYKGSIIKFMEDIGKGNKIIVVISEKYLKSSNCMFELAEIYENDDFAERIFPVVLKSANIYDPLSRLDYIDYWDKKIKTFEDKMGKMISQINILELQKELNEYARIRALFSRMSFILKDMNTLKPEMHRNKNFQVLYEYLSRP